MTPVKESFETAKFECTCGSLITVAPGTAALNEYGACRGLFPSETSTPSDNLIVQADQDVEVVASWDANGLLQTFIFPNGEWRCTAYFHSLTGGPVLTFSNKVPIKAGPGTEHYDVSIYLTGGKLPPGMYRVLLTVNLYDTAPQTALPVVLTAEIGALFVMDAA